MRWKNWAVAGVVLAGVAAGLGFYWPFHRRDEVLKLPGVVEIHEVRLGPRVSGRIKAVLVSEGDEVKPGQELVRLDVPDLLAQREVLQAKVREAEAEFLKAKNGPRPQEKAAARAAAASARARLERLVKGYRDEEKRQAAGELSSALVDDALAKDEMARVARMRRSGAASQAEYEASQAALRRAGAKVAMLRARHEMLEAGSRPEDVEEARAELHRLEEQVKLLDDGTRTEEIACAEARLAEAKNRLAELEVNIRESVIRAVEPAVVELVMLRPGDLVQPNQPVVRVLRTGDLWVKTYVPETELGKVRLGCYVQVSMDAFPQVRFSGKVVHIGAESEFTPRNVQTVDERRHQMFGVRVKIEDTKGHFKSGMAAEVYIPVQRD